MKKPDPKLCMVYTCKKCKREMPIDKEKSTKEQVYQKDVCPCGGTGQMRFSG